MSSWLLMLIGLFIGFIIGLFFGRKNYESCREQIQKLEGEVQARKAERSAAERRIEELQNLPHEEEEKRHEPESVASQLGKITATAASGPAGIATAPAATPRAEATQAEETPTVSQAEVEAPAPGRAADVAAAGAETFVEKVQISHCPQKLARIKGIGRVYEEKLYQAGIGAFWQVAMTPDEDLTKIFGLKDFQAVKLDAIKQSALHLAKETDTEDMVWSGSSPDDLESLPGIGKTYEARLYDAGVCTWKKLATLTVEELTTIVNAPKWNQPDYAAWIALAQEKMS